MTNEDIKLLKEYFDTVSNVPANLTNTVAKLTATYNIIVNQETLASLQVPTSRE